MMYYRILIMKVENNPAFDKQAADEWHDRQRTGRAYGQPYNVPAELGTRQLDVVLDDHEFQTVKQTIVKVLA